MVDASSGPDYLISSNEIFDGEKKETPNPTTEKNDMKAVGSRLSPKFEDLPLQPHHPPFSAWGLWGEHDEIGTLNHLNPTVILQATREIVSGRTVTLNLPINSPLRPMNPVRKPCDHRLIHKPSAVANDDEIDLNTQASSHFDGLRHYPYQKTLQYYNGVQQADITGPDANCKIGIQNIAQRGIVGRAVLLDWREHVKRKHGVLYSPFERHAITLGDLLEVAEAQQVSFRFGDILLIRTGWTCEYNKLSEKAKLDLPIREIRASCGVEASLEALKWHWDNRFAAVASDTVAYEVWPSPRQCGVSMHEVFLSGWGMPIGECWDLEELSRTCAELRKWTFFLTCSPLNVPGGVASPSNAIAIL